MTDSDRPTTDPGPHRPPPRRRLGQPRTPTPRRYRSDRRDPAAARLGHATPEPRALGRRRRVDRPGRRRSPALATLVLTSSQPSSVVLGLRPDGQRRLRRAPPRPARRPAPEGRRVPSKFPGFADQAALETKLDEVLDRLVSEGDRRQADVHERHQAVVRRPARVRGRTDPGRRRPTASLGGR